VYDTYGHVRLLFMMNYFIAYMIVLFSVFFLTKRREKEKYIMFSQNIQKILYDYAI